MVCYYQMMVGKNYLKLRNITISEQFGDEISTAISGKYLSVWSSKNTNFFARRKLKFYILFWCVDFYLIHISCKVIDF